MITIDQASNLRRGAILHHVHKKDSRGNPMRVRVSGQCKLWKTRPTEFKLPVKYGLYESGYITHLNASEWVIA